MNAEVTMDERYDWFIRNNFIKIYLRVRENLMSTNVGKRHWSLVV